MRLYGILIFNSQYELEHGYYDLSDFFIMFRYTIQSNIVSLARDIIKTIPIDTFDPDSDPDPDTHYVITEKINDIELVIYGKTCSKYYIVITDKSYPSYIARQLLYLIENTNNVSKNFEEYKNPEKVDKIIRIKSELEEAKTIILDSVDKLLERGENLENLIQKAKQLEVSSIKFNDRARDMNRCCVIL